MHFRDVWTKNNQKKHRHENSRQERRNDVTAGVRMREECRRGETRGGNSTTATFNKNRLCGSIRQCLAIAFSHQWFALLAHLRIKIRLFATPDIPCLTLLAEAMSLPQNMLNHAHQVASTIPFPRSKSYLYQRGRDCYRVYSHLLQNQRTTGRRRPIEQEILSIAACFTNSRHYRN